MLTHRGEPFALKAGAAPDSPRRRPSSGPSRWLHPIVTTLSIELGFWVTLALVVVALASCTLTLELTSHRHIDGDLAATSMGLVAPARWMGERDQARPSEPPDRPPAAPPRATATFNAYVPEERAPLVVRLAPDLTLAASSDMPPPVRLAALFGEEHAILPASAPRAAAPGVFSRWLIRGGAAQASPAPRPAPPRPLAPIPALKPAAAPHEAIPLPVAKPLPA